MTDTKYGFRFARTDRTFLVSSRSAPRHAASLSLPLPPSASLPTFFFSLSQHPSSISRAIFASPFISFVRKQATSYSGLLCLKFLSDILITGLYFWNFYRPEIFFCSFFFRMGAGMFCFRSVKCGFGILACATRKATVYYGNKTFRDIFFWGGVND